MMERKKSDNRIVDAALRFLAAFVFFMAVFHMTSIQAAQSREETVGMQWEEGKLPLEEISISGEDAEEIEIYEPQKESLWNQLLSSLFRTSDDSGEEAYWHQYSNYYLYNLMSEEEQAYYDSLDEACMEFLLSEDDAVYNKMNDIYYLPSVVSEDLTLDEMKTVYSVFKYNNGQYYFINSRLITLKKNGVSGVAPGIYKAFATGDERTAATEEVKEQLEAFSTKIEEETEPEKQAKLIHDLIIEKVSYNDAIYKKEDFDDETAFSQTIYSVLCMDKTVCAGYAQAFSVLCNRAGIDAISVTSATHEWNKVRLNDSWYNVDCTWDDQGSAIYTYYLRSDAIYDNGAKSSSHAEESIWDGYLPYCTLDTAPASAKEAGTLPEITQYTAKPVIQAVWQEQGYLVTISCETEDAAAYYTINGEKPTPAKTKSVRYRQPFLVNADSVIQAAAVSDTRLDSAVEQIVLTVSGENESSEKNMDSETEPTETQTTGSEASETKPTESQTAGSEADETKPTETQTAGSEASETKPTETQTTESETEPTETQAAGSEAGETKPTETQAAGSEAGETKPTETQTAESETGETKPTESQTEGSSKDNTLKKGTVFSVGGNTYKVTKSGTNPEVKFIKTAAKTTKLVIPDTVKKQKITYKVTAMEKKACSGRTKIKKVTIGKNITIIPQYAFKNCRNLKTIYITTKKLSGVKKDAFRGIHASAKIYVPAGKLKSYQKMLKGKGVGSKVKYIKISDAQKKS